MIIKKLSEQKGDYMNEQNLSPVVIIAHPTANDIFAYKMYHCFASIMGVGRIVFSAAFIALAVATYGKMNWLLSLAVLVVGLLNPVVTPLMFFFQAHNASATVADTMYTFSESYIHAKSGAKKADIKWHALSLAVWTHRFLLLYTSPTQALVLPRKQMQGRDAEVLAFVKTCCPKNRAKYVSKK